MEKEMWAMLIVMSVLIIAVYFMTLIIMVEVSHIRRKYFRTIQVIRDWRNTDITIHELKNAGYVIVEVKRITPDNYAITIAK